MHNFNVSSLRDSALFHSLCFGTLFGLLYNAQPLKEFPVHGFWIVAYVSLLNTCVFYALNFVGKVRIVLVPLLFVSASIASYFIYNLEIEMNGEMIAAVMETSYFEAKEFITVRLILWIALGFFCSMVYLRTARRIVVSRKQFAPLLCVVALLVIVFQAAGVETFKKNHVEERQALMPRNITPYSLADASGAYYSSQIRMKELGQLTELGGIPSEVQGTPPDVVIFIIGESARGDHFALNGYSRDTTPRLSAEPNVISFGNVTSFAASTRISVPAMLTNATSAAPAITTTSVLDLFGAQGYSTHWISLNDRFNKNNNPTTRLINNVQDRRFRSFFNATYETAKDHMMLPAVRDLVTDGGTYPKIVTIHTRGSHWQYPERYTKQFARWLPATSDVDEPQEVINGYDNSIAMTDDFIAECIDLVREKNAVVVYASDHGDSLGENGIYTHGRMNRPEQRHVPFIVWASDAYRKAHPGVWENMKGHAASALSHDYLYYTILSLGRIKERGHRYDLDLTSSSVVAGQGSMAELLAKSSAASQ
ncbi:lipid A phosphoethanolamine transferase [Desulfovibrio subterraneus]|uniref:phosphoethanolamine transferase n=1 Tax=Desulfovibrio subterraneus TaxID=2718620 RepID=UPI0022B8CD40|nr:lipid A phosphoethanolamine transferase [Desulfovibrio subterraneus]WBF66267.1 lipid A phosphoethanolamine transferase [Desulfovibrio subterraneus]